MRRRWPALAGALAVLAAGTAGCAEGGEQLRSVVPYCDNFGALILEAQSVPSTQLVPCLEALPLGWTVAEADVGADGSRIVLDSDRGGESAVVVTLEICKRLLDQGEMAEVQRQATRLLALLLGQATAVEALDPVAMLKRAAETGQLNRELLDQLQAVLEPQARARRRQIAGGADESL